VTQTGTRKTRAERLAMPLAREVVRDLAVEHGACIRPVQLRRTDLGTGAVEQILVPCGHTLAAVCPACAERARTLRAAQCREGWHLDDEPIIDPDEATDDQQWWIEKRAEAQAMRDQAADDGQDTGDLDELTAELDEEITDAGMRGNVLPARPVRRHRTTRRRQDAAPLPRRKIAPQTIGKTYTTPDGKQFRPSLFITLTCPSYGRVSEDGTPADPDSYDYVRAARDALHFAALFGLGDFRSILGMTSYTASKRTVRHARGACAMGSIPDPELTAIYCRRSATGDKQQVTVNRQKRLALEDCKKLGLVTQSSYVYIDNGASAWKRDRKRPGWDELISACKRGEIKHIVCYHPDRLMRQPRDLEELLSISDEYGIILYGRVNARDLQDPDDRYALRIEIAHACRSSDDTSRRLKDKFQELAEEGYYNGTRPYGYTKNGMKVVPKEADIVREVFRRFSEGETTHKIAVDLSARGVPTTRGKVWAAATVRRLLSNRHVAGISVHQGQEIGAGKWPAIITRERWDFTQELLAFRGTAFRSERAKRKPPRPYILRGLVTCGKCGTAMAGCSGIHYRCTRANRQDGKKCARSMRAEPLEQFVEDAAVRLLENLAVNPKRTRTTALEAAERAIEDDERQLAELHDMWISKEIDTAEYRKDRRTIQARMRENQKKTIVKVKSPDSIADLIGPDASAKWATLPPERKNSVLRFLFSAVIISGGNPEQLPRTIDYGRIEIEQNEIG